jgi:hypothetical protein
LFSQLGFLAVLIWILATALGKRNEATVKSAKPCRQHLGKGDRWAPGMVIGNYAQKQDFYPAAIAPDPRI